MPSEMVERNGLASSSFFAEEVRFPNERLVGFWKTETKAGSDGIHKASSSLEKYAVEAERAVMGKKRILNVDPASCHKGADEFNVTGAQYENGLFSSSMSELFSRKLRLESNHTLFGHSVGTPVSHDEEEESLETLEEIEAKTIGDLLPSDDDLLSVLTNGVDNYLAQPNTKEDTDDFDLFSSVGGLDLGDDLNSNHYSRKYPSRTLFVRNINSNVEDSELQTLFELYGDVHTLYTACKHRGFVMISYYDSRAAQNALTALQSKPLRHQKLDIHFSIPKDNHSQQDINQGTLVISNLDSSVSNEELRLMFSPYGDIKDIREAMQGQYKKLVHFYDVRAAEAAIRSLNRKEIAGNQIIIEAICDSIWSGAEPFLSETEQDECGLNLQQVCSPGSTPVYFGPNSYIRIAPSCLSNESITQGPSSSLWENGSHHGISASVPNNMPSLSRIESIGNTSALPSFHPYLHNDSLGSNSGRKPSERTESHRFHRVGSNGYPCEPNDNGFGNSANGSCSPGRHYMWSTSQHPQPPPGMMMWPNSAAHPPPRMQAIPRPPSHMLNNALLPLNNHHVGSAPSINPSLWDRRHVSPDYSGFHAGSLGSLRHLGNSPHHHAEYLSPNLSPRVGGNFMDMMPIHQRCMMVPNRGQMFPMLSNSFESPNERAKNRRNEGHFNPGENKKQFELDLDRIMRGDDKRTTLMLKNIPNKYTSKLLLGAIDERHRGTYDFIYLPIDFKNKCNVGYAFINMTNPSMIIPLYQAFNGKKWEKFNSEKVATLTYARIQGKAALIAHFQNSSLMNEDKRCRPILFNTDGPNAGDQVPFPMGANVRTRAIKNRASTSKESYQDSISYMCTGEELACEDSTSTRDSD